MPNPHSRDLRKGGVSHPNHAYLITTVTAGRKPLFTDLVTARIVVNALRFAQQQGWAKRSPTC